MPLSQKRFERCAVRILTKRLSPCFARRRFKAWATPADFNCKCEQRGLVNLEELQRGTDELCREANADPLHRLIGVFTMFRADTPQLFVDIDRTKCESLMVPVQDVFNALQTYMGGYYVNLFNLFGRTWQVNLMAEGDYRTTRSKWASSKCATSLAKWCRWRRWPQ